MRNKIIFLFLILCTSQAGAKSLYVSEELTIPMRSGPTTSHRIVKFLTSGAQLKAFEESEDKKFIRVITAEDEKEGWVRVNQVMDHKSARERLPGLLKRISSLKEEVKTLKAETKSQEETIEKLNREIAGISEQLKELRLVSREPAAIAQKNRELTALIEKVNAENKTLIEQNTILSDENIKEWFMIGGGVALVSLFFGLIIPNFRWRRKKDSWGGF